MHLWTDKYKPEKVGDILSQKKPALEALGFLESWKPGHALLLHGPPGVGKTLMAETLASEKGWHLLAFNASDKRSAERIESDLLESTKNHSLFSKGKLILIDEVDGLSSGDRGGAQSIAKVIRESKFPIIMTANDPYKQKLQNLRKHCKLVKFSRVNSLSIEKRLREICKLEGISHGEMTLKNLARWSSGDMRSALTDLQMVSLGKDSISDEDLSILGFRERGSNIFNVLPSMFKGRNINASRKVIQECDKDPDEIFWWVENNIHRQFRDPESMANAYDLISRADIFRKRVMKQQNWRFKAYMSDLIAGISLSGEAVHGFNPFQPPDRFIMLGMTKESRGEKKALLEKIGRYTHTSTMRVKNSFIPYIRLILRKEGSEGIILDDDELKLLA